MSSHQQTRDAYDRLSRVYDRLSGSFEDRHRLAALKALRVGSGESVLEVGCGTGKSLSALAAAVGDSGSAYGMDLSRGMLAQARRGVQAHLVQGDAVRIPLASSSCDCILMSFTLELFDQIEIPSVLHECARVLGSDGRLCVLGLSSAGRLSLMTRTYQWLHRVAPRYADCRPIQVRKAIEAAGLTVLNARASSLFGLRLETVLAGLP